MPMATIEGGDIHYSISGDGPPLVLLLPQSAGPVGVGPFMEALAKSCMVIRYDQRGTGQSQAPDDPTAITMPDRAKEVAGLLDALAIAQASLFCHSTGCGIGMAFAAAFPRRLTKLTLASPWSHGDGHLTGMQNLRIAAARALGPQDYAHFNASLLFPPDYRRAHVAGFARQVTNAQQQDADQIAGRLGAILAFDSRPLTPAITKPTLIITGADDQLMPAWFGQEISERIPDARYAPLNGGGHMLPETRTDAVVALTTAFLMNGEN